MLVTKIRELTKNRIEITLENGFSFVLYKGELRLYKIKESEEISEAAFSEIMNVVLPKRAKLRAMNLLKLRPYTEKGLYDKLSEGGYPDEIITIAMDYVKSFHYIDDNQYARDYIYTYKDRKNKAKLKQDLILKGVSKDIINQALLEELEEDGVELEKKQIEDFLRKKHYDGDKATYEEKMKFMSALYRKGYSVGLVQKLLDITSEYL